MRRRLTKFAFASALFGVSTLTLVGVGCDEQLELRNAPASIEAAGNITLPVEGCQLEALPPVDADVGGDDAGTPDADTSDAGDGDAGTADAGTSDAGTADAGTSDAGAADAGDAAAPFRARISRIDDLISLPYLIRDREGDDQEIRVEICEWNGTEAGACGAAVQGPGGDGTEFVPTTPAGTCTLHVFHWDVGCGRFIRQDGGSPQRVRLEDVDQMLVARFSVVGSDAPPSRTEPFALSDAELGFDAVPACE